MNEGSQLASAMLAVAFAGVMLVAGQLYIQSRPERLTAIPTSKNIHEARIIHAEMAEPQTTIALKRGDEKLH
jgi:deoxycytidylate deaminase